MKALIKTKSNFRNLNGQWLDVYETFSTRVTCKVWDCEFQKFILIDFHLREILGLKSI